MTADLHAGVPLELVDEFRRRLAQGYRRAVVRVGSQRWEAWHRPHLGTLLVSRRTAIVRTPPCVTGRIAVARVAECSDTPIGRVLREHVRGAGR